MIEIPGNSNRGRLGRVGRTCIEAATSWDRGRLGRVGRTGIEAARIQR